MFKSLIYITLPLILSFHDFHVTHTTLHYNSDLENLEITIKVAIEDLELSLEKKQLKIGNLNEKESADEIIESYFKNHLSIYGDNKIIEVGSPVVQGAKVEANLIKNSKNRTILIFKKRRRKNSRKKYWIRSQSIQNKYK